MEAALFALLPVIILCFLLIYAWYSFKELTTTLVEIATKLGLDKVSKKRFSGVRIDGFLNTFPVYLQGSFAMSADELTIALLAPSPYEIQIRRTRTLPNIDILRLIDEAKKPLKLPQSLEKHFEVFSSNQSIVRRIFSNSQFKELLEQCISAQSDSLKIRNNATIIKHNIQPFLFGLKETEK